MTRLRNTLGTALGLSASGLSVASKLLDAVAQSLRAGTDSNGADPNRESTPRRSAPDVSTRPASPPLGTEAVIESVADDVPQRGRVSEVPDTPLLDEAPHVRTSESHTEELAAKPAGQVAAAVRDLSTDELRLLTEYELAHRNRRTVLTAIERALAPS